MYKRSIPENITIIDYEKSDEKHYHKKDDAHYPIIKAMISDEKRAYYVKMHRYSNSSCGCQSLNLIFGYNPNNNSLNVYCQHCHYKHAKALSQVKNSCKRDTKEHAYFAQVQKDKDRFFCEICYRNDCLDIHHIVEVQHGGTDEEENLQLLCKNCHNLVHTIRRIKDQ